MIDNPRTQALVDVLVGDEGGLASVSGADSAKHILECAIERLRNPKPESVLERIRLSRYPNELLEELPKILGEDWETLEPYALILLGEVEEWEPESIGTFADAYWSSRVRERLLRNDFSRVWDELRKAYQGFNPLEPEPFQPINRGWLGDLAISTKTIASVLEELYAAMAQKGLVGEVSEEPILLRELVADEYELPSEVGFFKKRRLFPGEVFVLLFPEKAVPKAGQCAYRIGEYIAQMRNKKRKSRQKKKAGK